MSTIRTLIIAGLFSNITVHANAAENTLPWTFAACAGRFSAQMEHAWLMGTSDAKDHEANRGVFVSLLDAISTDVAGPDLLAHRIEAKRAQSRLIQAATFVKDKRRADFAQHRAASYLNACKKLLLGG